MENETNVNIIDYGFMACDNIKFEYEVSGNPDGETLVMLNGNGGDYRCCQDNIYPKMAEYFKIVRFSTRGTGNTPCGNKPLTFELFARDLKELLDYLKISEANFFGFSDGGNLGLVFAVTYPTYVKRLAIMGSNLNTFGTKTRDQLGIIKDHRIFAIKAAITKDEKIALKRDIEGLMVGQPRLDYKKISAINVPFLNIFGEFDMIKRSHSRKITKAVPGGEEIMVLGGGHGSSFQKKDFLLEPVLLHFYGAQ